MRRIRGAVGMGLAWGVAWALAGVLIGVTSNLLPGLPWHVLFDTYDAPLTTLAIPGFIGGVIFSTVLGIAARRRHFDELSLPLFAAWGAAAGALLGILPFTLASGGTVVSIPLVGVVAATLSLLCAASASGSLALARRAGRNERLGAGEARNVLEDRDNA